MRISVSIIILAVFISFTYGLKAQDRLYPNEFPLADVTLLDGPFKKARDLNIQVLLKYDVDRLLAPYRKEAGLPEKAKCYPNWEGLDGHVGGHYLSAMAMNYAATGNAECKRRMDYMISELKSCQDANARKYPGWGTGYIGGIPNSAALWTKIKNGEVGTIWKYWAPYYNIHKMYAGLRDAWLYAGNSEARNIFLGFCDWAIDITQSLSDKQMEEMLGNEHGGMDEVIADAYQITGDEKYLTAAERYSHKMFLDPLSQGTDILDNKHANTQIPKFIGFERIAELSHDSKYDMAGTFFWQTVTDNRSLAFGGNSRREHFPGKGSCIDFVNVNDGPETCNSYNMLKLTEDLFRVHPSARYTDYYERTVLNHILSSQHPEHGGYVYFTPARPRHYRVYSAPNEAMWCCVGTGMENHSKYNQFIYTHSKDSLFLNLFIASELNWKEKRVKIKQETDFPYEEQSKVTITEGSSRFRLLVRYPGWVRKGAFQITVNGEKVAYTSQPSSYVSIDRKWEKGDVVQISFPMHNTVEHLPNVPDYIAFMHGPVLLGAKTGTEDLKNLIAGDGRWGQYAAGEYLPVDKAPILVDDEIDKLGEKLLPVKDKPLNFKLKVKMINRADLILEPFYKIHDARYMMYWLALSNAGYKTYLDSIAYIEKAKLAQEKRTIDYVAVGEQQPETDHAMQLEKSNKGNNLNEFFREARDGGYFSYDLATNSETNLSLLVRYWGAEWGSRKFDIYMDDRKLVAEDNSDKWNQSAFKDVVYVVPDSLVQGKTHIRVRFQALPGSTAGAVYNVRLLRSGEKTVGSETQPYLKTSLGIKTEINAIQVEIQYYSPTIVRVIKTPHGKTSSKESLSVIKTPQKTDLSIKQQGEVLSVSSDILKVKLNLKNGQIVFLGKKGEHMLAEKAGGISFTDFNDAGHPTYSVRQSFELDKDETIYGLGQQQKGKMSQRNVVLNMVQGNTDDYIPFFQSVKGYGLFWDNYSPTLFTDNQDETSFKSDVGECADYYFMAGGNADGVVAQMRDLTGQAPMFPLWTYGFWQSKERYKSQEEVVNVVKKYRELGVPLDGIIQDWQYWGNNYLWNAMEFLNADYSNPKKMIDDVHNLNAHMIISIWNSFGPMTKPYKELEKIGALMNFNTWPQSGSEKWPPNRDYPSGVRVYDPYNPAARDIYWKYLNDGIFKLGMDGWWMDSSEPDHLDFKPSDFDNKTYMGSFRKVRNAFPLMTVGGLYQHQRAVTSGKRVFILTRSAFAGQQRYGANTWSGDVVASWDALRNQISAGLNFSLCAIPHWNSDIGGFFLWNFKNPLENPEYRELHARWIQFGTFCPMMRSHGEGAPREIYRFGQKGDKIYDSDEKYINLRYSLLPYIYSASWDVTANQSTMMRALVMDFANDKQALDINDEYMFGKSILVCPVTTPMYSKEMKEDFTTIKTKTVYLPKGADWYDFWTGNKFSGGQSVQKETPVDIMPLYIKAGSILPIGPKVQYAIEKSWDNLEIHVYDGADGTFTLYEDEYDNYNYEKGAYSIITFVWNDAKKTLTINDQKGSFPGMLTERKFNITLVGAGKKVGDKFDHEVIYKGKKVVIKL